jgi:hypothetical protein
MACSLFCLSWNEFHAVLERGRVRTAKVIAIHLETPKSKDEMMSASKSKSDMTCSAVIECLANVQPENVEWLWPRRIARGKLTLIVGEPNVGKSFLTLDIASRVSRGTRWPDNPRFVHSPGGVVLLSAEDGVADTIRPRLNALGADCELIQRLKAVHVADGNYHRGFDLNWDIERLKETIEQTPNCRLVIVDPISAYLGTTDSNANAEVRRVLTPLSELAAEKRVAILAVSHLRKSDGSAIHRAIGSIGFAAAARAVWLVTRDMRDKRDPDRRLFLVLKNNLAYDGNSTGLAYRIEADGPDSMPKVRWEPEPVTISADDALTTERKEIGRPPTKRDKAKEFLQETLAAGPQLQRELEDEARTNDISQHTLDRAKADLDVTSFRVEPLGSWFWELPNESVRRYTEENALSAFFGPSDTASACFDATNAQDIQLADFSNSATNRTPDEISSSDTVL